MDQATYNRLVLLRDYEPEFYIRGNDKNKSPGIHRLKIDNRILEISLPGNSPPDSFGMPETLHTKGDAIESMINYLLKRLPGDHEYKFPCFKGYWEYSRIFSESAIGGVGASVGFDPDPFGFIRDKTKDTLVPGSSIIVPGGKNRKLDYFKLEDFIIYAQGFGNNPLPVSSVMINGRRWVQTGYYWGWDKEKYRADFYTPIDRHRRLNVTASLNCDYKIPDQMPDWMRKLCDNITSVLRSIKLSPPDDGSEDPFLLDPEQKPSLPLIEFPASPSSG
jgi:hypothetical protein